MYYHTLITPTQLAAYPHAVVVDCRHSLADPDAGHRAYLQGHLPGAIFAHLDHDLSGPIVPGQTGRHPLPDPTELAARLGAWGIGSGVQVVAYDDAHGAIAARLWWLLRWLGHDTVAVLEGGWQAWLAEGLPTDNLPPQPQPRTFVPQPRPELVADADTVDQLRLLAQYRLLDARAPERYRGEVEPIDPVAGHIPGAVNAPFTGNLTPEGHFLSPEALRQRFNQLAPAVPTSQLICYCGSGVTACHNLLAIAHAGLPDARLYPGSWSEWVTDPRRAVATDGE